MLVDLIKAKNSNPLELVKYLSNDKQIFGSINYYHNQHKNYLLTANIIKTLILQDKIKSLKPYRNIIKNIYSEFPNGNEVLYLHCLIDCNLIKDATNFLNSIQSHSFRTFLSCFFHLQLKNYGDLIEIFKLNIDEENIVSSFLPSLVSELSQKNNLEYIKILHTLHLRKDKYSKETQDLIENVRFSYLQNKNISLVIACMDRQDNLIKILPSWISIPYISQIVIVDYSSKNLLSENNYIKLLQEDGIVEIVRVDNEKLFNLGKAYNIGFDHCKYDTILKIDCDYLCLDHTWLDIIYKSKHDISNLIIRACYTFSSELSGFFLIDKSKLLYFREDLNGYGYDELDLYNRTKLAFPNIKEIVWFDIENSIKHLHHDDKQRTKNYISRDKRDSEFENRKLCNQYSPVLVSRNSYTKDTNIKFNKKFIDKIFCINLENRIDRWESLQDIPNIQRFNAIIASENTNLYGLKLDPVDISSKLYFKLHPGAIGCYLSHYSIWNTIVEQEIEYSLVLEDDVEKESIQKLLKSNIIIENHELINLSKRFRKVNTRYLFDGGESYILSYTGAKKLLDLTHNTVLLNKVVPEKMESVYNLVMSSKLVDDPVWKNNSISCAVDKFMGYCCEACLPENIRINSYIYPIINLNEETSRLSNINHKIKQSWSLSEKEILDIL